MRDLLQRLAFRIWDRLRTPGGGFSILGLLQMLWSRGKDINFALTLWRGMGGLPMIVSVITSPLFGAAMIVVGLSYMLLMDAPGLPIQRHSAIPAIGWSALALCTSMIAAVLLFGYFISETRMPEIV